MSKFLIVIVLVACNTALLSQDTKTPSATAQSVSGTVAKENPSESTVIPKGAKVFVASMPNGFDEFIRSAIEKKKVPVVVTEKREEAEFEITGTSETQKAGAAKIIIMGSWHSRETASIKVANLKTDVIAFAYSYDTNNSAHGKKTSSEACAKHLKEKIDSGK